MAGYRRLDRLGCLARFALLLLAALCHGPPAAAREAQEGPVDVHVQLQGDTVIADVAFRVRATRSEAWAVLTDYPHMASFVSNLRSSRVVAGSGLSLQVLQSGRAEHGPLSYGFESLREIELVPERLIRSRQIAGSMKRLEGLTEIRADGDFTLVSYHGESVPEVWIPPLLGPAFIENELREQFIEMRNEILRRKKEAAQNAGSGNGAMESAPADGAATVR